METDHLLSCSPPPQLLLLHQLCQHRVTLGCVSTIQIDTRVGQEHLHTVHLVLLDRVHHRRVAVRVVLDVRLGPLVPQQQQLNNLHIFTLHSMHEWCVAEYVIVGLYVRVGAVVTHEQLDAFHSTLADSLI